jgi:chlorite dismutase
MMNIEAITIEIEWVGDNLQVTHGLRDSHGVAATASSVADRPAFVHALALAFDPGWRRQGLEERRAAARCFMDALRPCGPVRTLAYSTVGLRRDVDLVLWTVGPSPDGLEERAAVAYETDDLAAFSELVHALRATESRRATVRDTAVLTGVHRPHVEMLRLLTA